MSAMGKGGLDLSRFTLVQRGHLYEDFEEGRVFEHHWGRTITEADNVVFSTATCNWSPIYLNVELARAHGLADVAVNPMLVVCVVVGLSVEDLSEVGGPFLGIDDCRFHGPVYPGDTLTARSVVLERRVSASRPGSGVVTWRTGGRNQRDETVVELRRTNLVARREGSGPP